MDRSELLSDIDLSFKKNENFEMFSKIFEKNPLPMSINDIKNKSFVKVNPAFLKTIGYEKEDIVGKKVEETELFFDINKIKALRDKKISGKEVIDEEISIRHQDGKLIKCLLSIEDIMLENKMYFLLVMVDVTEREELAKSVEDKLQKLTNVIDGAELGTWEWDIRTGEVETNENFAKMIGYSLEELNAANIDFLNKLMSPKYLERSKEIMESHLNGDTEYYNFEVEMKHKNGKWIWVHDRGKVTQRDKNGIAIKIFGIYADITLRKEAEIKLKESEKRYLLALDQAKAGLWDLDMETGKTYFSPMLKKILGYEDHEIGDSFEELKYGSSSEDRKKLKKAKEDYLNGKTDHYEVRHRLKHKDGDRRWILSRGGILKDEMGQTKRWIGTNIDVTKEQEQALELERFFSINLDLLCIIDINGKFIKINTAWESILGFSSKEIKGKEFKDFINPEDLSKTVEAFEKLKEDGKLDNFINRYNCSDGECNYIEWKANLYGDVIYAAARNVTDRIKYEKKILEISNRDSLTNIYNRRHIYERSREIIEEYKRNDLDFSICILDIDKFKKINDSYGHQVGDFVLKEFTRKIKSKLRPYDLLGRYGGEEFIIILKNTNLENSNSTIERILKFTRNTDFVCDDIVINFTFSGGISNSSEFKKEKITIDALVKLADERMYKAKNNGRNKIVAK